MKLIKLVTGVTLALASGLLGWFELVTVPTALHGHLNMSAQFAFVVGSWQVIKLVLLVGGGFVAGHLLGRKGVFDTYRVLVDQQLAPLHHTITSLHKTAMANFNSTVGKAVLDGTRLGVRMSGDAPQVSRGDLLAGLDRLALPPVAGGWEPASSEQDDLETYKNNLS